MRKKIEENNEEGSLVFSTTTVSFGFDGGGGLSNGSRFKMWKFLVISLVFVGVCAMFSFGCCHGFCLCLRRDIILSLRRACKYSLVYYTTTLHILKLSKLHVEALEPSFNS